jgi:RNA polymerase sigma factor (TIGR02999 family)
MFGTTHSNRLPPLADASGNDVLPLDVEPMHTDDFLDLLRSPASPSPAPCAFDRPPPTLVGAEDPIPGFLAAYERGDEGARAELFSRLYGELRSRATRLTQKHGRNETLRATAIVHEVYLRLARGDGADWHDRAHFLAAASRTMRHVLIDYARSRQRRKRKADGVRVAVDEILDTYQDRAIDLEALDRALDRLAGFDLLMAQAVELRFFGGASVEETAQLVGMSKRTLERRWEAVRAWLRSEIG